MIPDPTMHWHEIVAAYADGEFEGRDDLALLKRRVEEWLARHPEEAEELADNRLLKQLWHETAPEEPGAPVWNDVRLAIDREARRVPGGASWRTVAVTAASLAACVALAIGWMRMYRPPEAPVVVPQFAVVEDEEPFRVAAAHEVEVLHVEGADTHTLVVGELPVTDAIKLAEAGEVRVTSVQPAAHDNALPEVSQGTRRPMIWARLETD